MRKDIALTRFCLVKYLLPAPSEVQYMNVLEKPMRFLTLGLKAKLIISEGAKVKS